jgi:hypothetical protein
MKGVFGGGLLAKCRQGYFYRLAHRSKVPSAFPVNSKGGASRAIETALTSVPTSPHCVGPHLIRDFRIAGRHKM